MLHTIAVGTDSDVHVRCLFVDPPTSVANDAARKTVSSFLVRPRLCEGY